MILLIPLFAKDLGASVAETGIAFAFLGVGTIVSNVPTGFAISRFGEKRLMLFGLTLLMLVGVVAGQTQTLLLLTGCAFVYGVGIGVWRLTRLNYISEELPIQQRGRGLSILGCLGGGEEL